ncbi:MAG: aldose 1-epimerase [Planctomycetia bacterium]|nr:aldose 1-epimerase [Planctomycetia bacterium]
MPHRVTTEPRGGRTVYTLHDDATGASASILPAYGFNLFDLRLPAAGAVRPMVASAADFAENPVKPARNGVPVLFPFPNRVNHGTFAFRGKTYTLPINSGAHAIHGFALTAPWDVVDQKADAGGAAITGRYQISKNTPEMLAHWPTDAVLQVRYALSGRRLTMTVTVTNPTADDLPYGFGIHPYFRLPFTPGGDQEKTRVVVPASEVWTLDGFIPTGERRPVDDRLDFRKGKPIKGLKLDDVLTGLEHADGQCVCRLEDLALKAEFRLSADRAIRELVLFTPPGVGDVIAIEPYTQTTDAVNLASRGIDGGLKVLGHGKTESFMIVMETAG